MNKVCSLSIQRVCNFSESREKSKRSLTARLLWLAVPQPSIIHWRAQNSFQTTMPYSLTWNSLWEQGLSVFPLLPTHRLAVSKAVCLIPKCLYRAGQRCLSEVVPAAPWAAFHSFQVVAHLTSSSPQSYWCQEQGEEGENDLKEERKELRRG